MKFEEAIPYLREGKRIKNKSWKKDTYFYRNDLGFYAIKSRNQDYLYYSLNDFLDSDDWEIMEEE